MVHILSNYQLSHEMTKIPKLLLSSSLQSFLSQLIKEYVFFNRLYDITWFGQFTLYKPWRVLWKAYSIYCSKPSYTSITCSKIEHIPYNLIFTTKCNDSSILITITSWDYLNLSLVNEYVGDVTIPTLLSSITNVAPGGSVNQIAVFTSN
jgi:hypothetical protein